MNHCAACQVWMNQVRASQTEVAVLKGQHDETKTSLMCEA